MYRHGLFTRERKFDICSFFFSEYGGKWKMLHYFAKNFFAPILISPYLDGNDVNVYIIKDELPEQEVPGSLNHSSIPTADPHQSASEPVNNSTFDFMGTLYIEMYSWSSMTPLHTWEFLFMVRHAVYEFKIVNCCLP